MSSWDFTTMEQSEPSHSPDPKISFSTEQSKPSHSPVPKTFLLSDKKGTDSQSLSLGPLLSPLSREQVTGHSHLQRQWRSAPEVTAVDGACCASRKTREWP